MNQLKHLVLLLLPAMVSPLSSATASAKPAVPFINPYLAASTYSVTHMKSNVTPLAGPLGPGRRLRAAEVQWKPTGPVNEQAPMYSGPYPNGKRVIWIGGYDRVAKLDADTLEALTTYAIGGNTYFGNEEVERHITTINKLDDKAFVDYNLKVWAEPFKSGLAGFYRLLSRDNELYLSHRGTDGLMSLQVYGEADAADPASKILLKREWKIPADITKANIMSINMTSDGWIVMVMQDGVLVAVSRDLATHDSLKLPSRHEEASNQDFLSSFVRNGVSTDDQNGIYVVTRDHMHRVQWTGSKLSLDEADGAWSAPYPNELGIGSGTTPGLVGWGPKEDHLVVIADGTGGDNRGNNMMAFWRDKIPDDWKGLPGFDRRVAGITPIHFGVSKTERVQVENSAVIYGYGVFFNNTYPVKRLTNQGIPTRQWMADSFSMHVPGYEALGGSMLQWDPQARTLKTAWQSQINFASALCTVSNATGILYCWGARNREWTLEGLDWNTGKSTFHYTVGKDHRFNPMGAPIIIAPNGAVDCGCTGGMGIVRVKPKQGSLFTPEKP